MVGIMAIIKVYNELAEQDWFQELMNREFDEVEELKGEPMIKVFRVQHEEISKEDKQFAFDVMNVEGIKPFIVEFY